MSIQINRSAPNLVMVCVNEYTSYDFNGFILDKFSTEPKGFSSAKEMMDILEEFYNTLNFPQPSLRQRNMVGCKILEEDLTQMTKEMRQVQGVDEMMEQKGELATFVIHVQYRKNATWQGKLIWTDKKTECNFRSAMEMIRLMDQALDYSSQKKKLEKASGQFGSEEDLIGGQ